MSEHHNPPSPQSQEQPYQPEPVRRGPNVDHLDGLPVENLHRLFVGEGHQLILDAEEDKPGDDPEGHAKQQRHERAAREAQRLDVISDEIKTGPKGESVQDMMHRVGVFVRDLRAPHEHVKPSYVGARRLPPQMFSPGERVALAKTAERFMRDLANSTRDDLEPIVGPFRTPPPPPPHGHHPHHTPPHHRTGHGGAPHGTGPLPSHPARGVAPVPVSPPHGGGHPARGTAAAPPSSVSASPSGPPTHDTASGGYDVPPHYDNLEGVSAWDMLAYVEAQEQRFEEQAQQPGLSDPIRAGLAREIEVYEFIRGGLDSSIGIMGDSPDEVMASLVAAQRLLGQDDYDDEPGLLGDPRFRERAIDVIDRLRYAFSTMTSDHLHDAIAEANAPRVSAAPHRSPDDHTPRLDLSSPEPASEPNGTEHHANLEGVTGDDLEEFLAAKAVELAQGASRSGMSDDERAHLKDEINLYLYYVGDYMDEGDTPDQMMAALARRRKWLMDDSNQFQDQLANRDFRQRLAYTLDDVHSELSGITVDRLRETIARSHAVDPKQLAELFSSLGFQPSELGLDSDTSNP